MYSFENLNKKESTKEMFIYIMIPKSAESKPFKKDCHRATSKNFCISGIKRNFNTAELLWTNATGIQISFLCIDILDKTNDDFYCRCHTKPLKES